MSGLSSHLFATFSKIAFCTYLEDHEKYSMNIGGLLFVNLCLASTTSLALWAFHRVTRSSSLQLDNIVFATKFVIAFIMIYPWLVQSSRLANPFAACPFDFFDYALEIALYTVCLEAIILAVTACLRLGGSRDWTVALIASGMVFGVMLTIFKG